MTTTFNSRSRGPAAFPRFSGKVLKVTGEGEQVELAFTAETPEELRDRLAAAGAAASARLTANNDAIVNAGATFAERQRQAYDAALATLREEVTTMLARREEHEPPTDEPGEGEGEPVGPPAPGDAPAEDEEPPDADAATRALHAPADP